MSELTAVLLARYHGTAGYAVLAALLGGRHSSAYKLVFNELARVLHEHWFDKLMSITRFAHKAPQWANAIFRRTHASPRVIGFLDGTFIRVCRPSGPYSHQRQLYNRYYKGHGYKFQSMMAACGLMFSLFAVLWLVACQTPRCWADHLCWLKWKPSLNLPTGTWPFMQILRIHARHIYFAA